MPETVLGLACLLLCTSVLQIGSSESCKLKVKMLNNTVHQISCFNKMRGEECAIGRTTSYCNIEKKNGHICIKWTDADMTCRKVDQELSKVPLENGKCAQDQESLDCIREFTDPGDAKNNAPHVTTCLEGLHLMLLPLFFFGLSKFNVASVRLAARPAADERKATRERGAAQVALATRRISERRKHMYPVVVVVGLELCRLLYRSVGLVVGV
ncbi:hypothetical protein SRHO_G00158240 [Serrasalmus rhombeus]